MATPLDPLSTLGSLWLTLWFVALHVRITCVVLDKIFVLFCVIIIEKWDFSSMMKNIFIKFIDTMILLNSGILVPTPLSPPPSPQHWICTLIFGVV